ncbi:hypothetical protein AVEN_261109-1 [Araneus ventricosus]|uniref:Uncharacterized protein n=1 Tax=Araneus ventricosus TaxID=182803 RepID=A0A4Y2TTY1_ARAVE|nr:hypothetical protein AVEN_261109-1 [Araneus ventricosus]
METDLVILNWSDDEDDTGSPSPLHTAGGCILTNLRHDTLAGGSSVERVSNLNTQVRGRDTPRPPRPYQNIHLQDQWCSSARNEQSQKLTDTCI